MPRQVDILTLRTYAKSAWVQMVVMTITKQLMTTEWKIVPKNEDEDVEKYEKEIKKIETFLNQPNRNNSTFWDVWMPFIRDVLELDAGVIYKGKNVKGELVEIFASDGSRFLFDIEPNGIINGYYQYSWKNPASIPRFFEKDEIIYGRINTNSEYMPYGFSPLQSVQQEVELMIQSTRYNKEFFKNNSIPDGIVSAKMNAEQLKYFKADWEKIKGDPHKLIFINGEGIDFKNLQISNKEMEWLDGQKWYFHVIFGAYGLSPQEAGFYEQSNRSTGESQERITVKNAIQPYLNLIASKINKEIIPELVGHDELKFIWDVADAAAEKIKHDQTMQLLQANALTINEVRGMEGFPDVPWGDQPFAFTQQERFVESGGSQVFEGRQESYNPKPKKEEKPKDRDNKEDRDNKKEEREKEPEKKEIEERLIKGSEFFKEAKEFIEEDEAKEYTDFLRKKFRNWEKEINKFLERTLKDEIENKSYETTEKSFGDFLQNLFNRVNTTGFLSGLKRIVRVHLKEGVEDAEEETSLDIGISEDFNDMVEYQANRQLEGFHIDGKKWNGIKGIAREVQIGVADIVREGLANKKTLKDIKKEIKGLMIQHIGGKVEGEVTEGRSMKIARTETNRFRNAGRLKAYKDSGVVEKKEWVALHDDKTTDICKRLHGQKVGIDEHFTDELTGMQFMHPPALPNCRSVMRAVLR